MAEAYKGTWFALASLAVAWGATFGLAGASWMPAIVAGFIIFLPPIFALVGLIHTVGAWKNISKINGLLVPAVLGTVLSIAALGSIAFLLVA